MQIEALTSDDLASGADGAALKDANLLRATPLWYYILKEALLVGGGQRLGPMGSILLAEVFVGMLQGDPNAFLAQSPGWTPTLPSAKPGQFTMADLLQFADQHSPVINAADDPRNRPPPG
jgi:hypothetical protein